MLLIELLTMDILFFVHVYHQLFTFITKLQPSVLCKDHFGITQSALDSKVIPVRSGDTVCVPANKLTCKCVYIEISSSCRYIVTFPNQFLSD